ncbi:MAG: formylglycine-generating enzyme family protein [Alkalispirochaeta sp.]
MKRRWPTILAGVAAAVVLSSVATGCAGTPDELPPEERPRVTEGPESAPLTTDDPLQFTFDRRGASRTIATVEIAAYPAAPASGQDDASMTGPDAEPARRWELPPDTQSPLRVTVPLEGLEDGTSYALEFTLIDADGTRFVVDERVPLELALGLPRPVPQDELVTLDRRPPLEWRLPDGAGDAEPGAEARGEPETQPGAEARRDRITLVAPSTAVVRISGDETDRVQRSVPDAAGPWEPEEPLADAGAFSRRAAVVWQVRVVSPHGVLGPWSPEGRVRFDLDRAIPRPRAHAEGGEAVVATPGLSWEPTAGAVSYRVEVGAAEREDSVDVPGRDPERWETNQPRLRLGPEELEAILDGAGSRTIRWRVAAIGPEGVETPFSETFRFRYIPRIGGLETIVPVDARVTVLLGREDAEQVDERPAVPVALARPFEMSRYPVTNRIVAALVDLEVAAGRWEVTADDVRTTAATPRVLIGLEELDFGEQFGLRAEDGRLTVIDGYAAHPAVGVTWYGALAVANALSLLEARDAVYEGLRSAEDEVEIYPDRDGYRVPTEAEWAAAVAARQRIVAGAELTLVEARDLSSLDLRGINFLRSGDRWEDPRPPYTRNGGPTSPVGSVGRASPVGVSDLLGNVWEWTADWYVPQWYRRIAAGEAQSPWTGPTEPEPDVYGRHLRTVRGTAWNTPQEEIRPGNRGGFAPEAASHSIGIRLVRTLR